MSVSSKSFPLEPTGDEIRQLVDAAMERIVPYLESLGEQPASLSDGADELVASLQEGLPRRGTALDTALDTVFRAAPLGYNAAGPGYLAYIPGGGIFHAALGAFVADCLNRYVGIWAAAPGLVQLELNAIRWLGEIVGYPQQSGGLLTTGGSIANLIAVVTARRERLGDDFLEGTIYTSDQAHHSVRKAALIAGFPEGNVREVPSDADYRVDLGAMEQLISEDCAQGMTPLMIVAQAGTTNTGAIDDLEGLGRLAASRDLWLHVDAAYGGFFMLTDHGRRALQGIEVADSITLDPHKGLFLPYGTGALLVRDPGALARAHQVGAHYLPAISPDPRHVDFCHLSPELSREFRGLRVWLPLKVLGAQVFADALDEKLALAREACRRLEAIDGIEILAPPQLSVLAFRLRRPGLELAQTNRLNRDLLDRVNRRRRVLLTGTLLRDVFAIRIAILSFRTHQDRLDMAIEDIETALAEL